MRRIIFPTGYAEALQGWTTEDFEWVLVTGSWVQDETVDIYMSDIAAYETTAPEYTRLPVTSPVVAVDLPDFVGGQGYVGYYCDNPEFGVLSGGDFIEALVLINVVTNDSDSPLVGCIPTAYSANGVNSADFVVGSFGALAAMTTC